MTKSTVDAARKIVADLIRQLDQLETQALTLSSEQQAISYRAHVENEPAAKKRLATIKTELTVIGQDMSSLRAAVDEADRRVIEAKDEERGVVEKARAERALVLGREMRNLCKQIDTFGRDYFLAFIQLRNVMLELSRLGGSGLVPSVAMFDAVCKRAYAAQAMGSPLEVLHLAKNEQHSFVELSERWGKNIDGWAAQRLDAVEAKDEAA